MKKHLSVFQLMVSIAMPGFFLVLLVMTGVEGIMLGISLYNALSSVQEGFYPALDTVFSQSHMVWVCMAAFIACTMMLCMVNNRRSAGNLLSRLSVSKKSVFMWQAVCNVCCWVIFWAIQVGIILLASHLYMCYMDPRVLTDQTVVFTFYRYAFLHRLMPLGSSVYCVRNVLLVLALGIVCAYASQCFWQEKQRTLAVFHVFLLLFLIIAWFAIEVYSETIDRLMTLCFLFFAVEPLYLVFGKEKRFHET